MLDFGLGIVVESADALSASRLITSVTRPLAKLGVTPKLFVLNLLLIRYLLQ